jgi:hypothetical protein
MKDPLLARIVSVFPIAKMIGWLKYPSSECDISEYELEEEQEGIRYFRMHSNGHPVFVITDDTGDTWHYSGVLPG